jgi:hypothetical protein
MLCSINHPLETAFASKAIMEAMHEVLKDLLSGQKVRIGYQGLVPIFSLSQALNLVNGMPCSHQFGRSFIHQTIKEKHVDLFQSIIHFKFPQTSQQSPCMKFSNLLSCFMLVRSTFSVQLRNVTVPGNQTLAEHILQSIAPDDECYKLVRKILYAEKHHDLALQGIGPVEDYVDVQVNAVSSSSHL